MEIGKPELLYEPESRNLDARDRAEQWEIHRSDIRLPRESNANTKGGFIFLIITAGLAIWTWAIFF